MPEDQEISRLKHEVDRLSAENERLRQHGFRGSKAEMMLAFEYDRIPSVLKTARAIRIQRTVATIVLYGLPIVLAIGAIIGGIDAYKDHMQSLKNQREWSKFGDELRRSVQSQLDH